MHISQTLGKQLRKVKRNLSICDIIEEEKWSYLKLPTKTNEWEEGNERKEEKD